MSMLVNLSDGSITPFALAAMLMHDSGNDQDTIITEVLAFFAENESMAFRFLKCFGGRVIKVPTAQRVKDAFLSVHTYLRCEELHKKNAREDVLTQVAAELNMTRAKVSFAWRRVTKQCARLEKGLRECLRNQKL